MYYIKIRFQWLLPEHNRIQEKVDYYSGYRYIYNRFQEIYNYIVPELLSEEERHEQYMNNELT